MNQALLVLGGEQRTEENSLDERYRVEKKLIRRLRPVVVGWPDRWSRRQSQ